MWGYNLAARNMGIRHTVMKNLQVEPQGTGTDDMENNYIYHYTFGQVTRTPTPNPTPNTQPPTPNTRTPTPEPQPPARNPNPSRNPNPPPHPPLTLCVDQSAAGWRLDKRSYFGGYPSDQLALPPVCSPASLT